MTFSPSQERGGGATQPPERGTTSARMAHWRRIALGCAAGGAAVTVALALAAAWPLPAIAPPPAGVAPLLPSGAAATSALAPSSPAAAPSGSPGIGSPTVAPPAAGNASASGATSGQTGSAQGYLAFLRGIDQQRGEMLSSLDAALTVQSSAAQEFAGSGANGSAAAASLTQTAQSVESAFQAQPAPAECSALAAAYGKLLQDQCAMVTQAAASLSTGDTRGAGALAAGDERQMDSDAQAADQALGASAAALQSDKPFTIVADPSGGSLSPSNASPAAPGQPIQAITQPQERPNSYAPAIPAQNPSSAPPSSLQPSGAQSSPAPTASATPGL